MASVWDSGVLHCRSAKIAKIPGFVQWDAPATATTSRRPGDKSCGKYLTNLKARCATLRTKAAYRRAKRSKNGMAPRDEQ
ncbi:hypothetical protein SEPCBS57363_003199 [Sporothrix epigloea]|uniref:Uncharacterized protein n=1 Tax=Sporothrix epigloea TaxID=1892477 RepID=A0ABP0DMY6_9PEZI